MRVELWDRGEDEMSYKAHLNIKHIDGSYKFYKRITSFKTWSEDSDYYIFYWEFDKTDVVIKKEYIVSIEKYIERAE